jgi:hypothetical protein
MATRNQPIINNRPGTFQEKTVPPEAQLAGWAWLIQSFGVRAPVRRPSVVSDQHVKASLRAEPKSLYPGFPMSGKLVSAISAKTSRWPNPIRMICV